MPEPPSTRHRGRKRFRLWHLGVIAALLVAGAGAFVLSKRGPSAGEHLQRAGQFQAGGDLRAAVIELKNALQQQPDLGAARLQLGRIYLELGNGPAAAKELELAQKHGQRGRAVTLDLLRAMLLQGRYEEVLGRITTMDPGDDEDELLVLRGEAQLGMRRPDEAQAAFDKALELRPASAVAQRGLAKVALTRGRLDEAEKQLDLSLDSSKEDVQTWLLKGELDLTQTRIEAAQTAFETALRIDPNHAGARLGVARALLAQGKTDAAGEHLARLHKRSPKHPLINYFRAVAARQKNDLPGAKTALREVLAVAPSHPQSLLLMGSIHYMQREYAQGEDLLNRFVAAVPGHLPGRKLLAATLLQLRRPADAVRTLTPALASAQDDAQLLALLGSAHMANQEYDKGTELLQQAAELAPDIAAIRTQLAVSHLAAGATEKAVTELKSAVELDPKFARADLLLVFTHLQKQEYDAALEVARRLAEKQPDNPVAFNLMGAAYVGKQDLAAARSQYEKALAVQPGYVNATLNLARLDEQKGDLESARQRYESVLEKHATHAQALVALARFAGREGDNEKAVELLERARASNARALAPRLLLTDFHLRRREAAAALVVAEEAAKLAPSHPLALLGLGRAQFAAGNRDAALATFAGLVEKYPRAPNAHYYRGVVQSQSGQLDAARRSLQKTLELASKHLLAKLALGNLELRAGNAERALAIAAELKQAKQGGTVGLVLEGDAQLAKRQPEAALAAYDAAFKLTPAAGLVLRRYRALVLAGRRDEATAALRAWLDEHPEDSAVRLALAGTAHQSGQKGPAIQEYERVLERNPRSALALNNLAWLYHERNDPRALEFAEKAYRLVPERAEILDTYGWLLVRAGKVEQGLRLLEKAVKKNPRIADIRYHLAAGLAESGDKAGARRKLEALLASEEKFAERGNAEALLETLQ